jgi:hypothetical protein
MTVHQFPLVSRDPRPYLRRVMAELTGFGFVPPFEMCRDETEPGLIIDARGKTIAVVDPSAEIAEPAARAIAMAIAILLNVASIVAD